MPEVKKVNEEFVKFWKPKQKEGEECADRENVEKGGDAGNAGREEARDGGNEEAAGGEKE